MTEQESIKQTLDVIRKALEEDSVSENYQTKDILILNKLVKNDGTIDIIQNQSINKNEIKEILNEKISQILNEKLDNWINNNMDEYLSKKFDKK